MNILLYRKWDSNIFLYFLFFYFLLTMFCVSQVLSPASPVAEESASGLMTVMEMCQQLW